MAQEEVIKEGFWKCPNCDNRNRGRELNCPGCGQARENIAFEYDEGEAAVQGAELDQARSGEDWVCGYCSTSNRAGIPKCGQCGAGSDEGQRRATGLVGQPAPAARPAPASVGMPLPIKLAIGGFVALVALFIGLALWTTEETLPLTAKSWSRRIAVESLQWVEHEAWEGQVPSRARILSHRSEVYETRKVKTGTKKVKTGVKDMGNGYFKEIYEEKPVYREEPVHRQKYRYEIEEWREKRHVTTSGNQGAEPQWGVVHLAAGEREGPRREEYAVTFQGEKTYTYEPAFDQYRGLQVGKSYIVTINGLGSVVQVR